MKDTMFISHEKHQKSCIVNSIIDCIYIRDVCHLMNHCISLQNTY